MCDLPNVYIVSHDDLDRVKVMMQQRGVQQVYTPERKINFIRSRFGTREDDALLTASLHRGAGSILAGDGVADVEQVRRLQPSQQLCNSISQHYHSKACLQSR